MRRLVMTLGVVSMVLLGNVSGASASPITRTFDFDLQRIVTLDPTGGTMIVKEVTGTYSRFSGVFTVTFDPNVPGQAGNVVVDAKLFRGDTDITSSVAPVISVDVDTVNQSIWVSSGGGWNPGANYWDIRIMNPLSNAPTLHTFTYADRTSIEPIVNDSYVVFASEQYAPSTLNKVAVRTEPTSVPEAGSTMALLGIAMGGMVALRRRMR